MYFCSKAATVELDDILVRKRATKPYWLSWTSGPYDLVLETW